ncbi:MAG: hypothetical protein ACR2O6_12490 [Ilumatobacteraceae bacterium]
MPTDRLHADRAHGNYTCLPHVVLGDLNATLDSPPVQALLDDGYASTLTPEDGPTSTLDDEHHIRNMHSALRPRGMITR